MFEASWLGNGLLLAGIVVLVYAYLGYPLGIALYARLRPRPLDLSGPRPASASVVMAVRDEAARVEARVQQLVRCLDASGVDGEVIVASDGSIDATATTVRRMNHPQVRLVELNHPVGKSEAISRAADVAAGEVLIMADVRQHFRVDTITELLAPFEDPSVGAVSGELVLTDIEGVLRGVGAYWKYEKWIRRNESRCGSMVGVTGAVSAVRRSAFAGVPQGTILDDVYWPLRVASDVASDGNRVVFWPAAVAEDRLPDDPHQEFRRKVRTLTGNFQLLKLCPSLCVPMGHPLAFRFWSHKMSRLACPWAMMAIGIGAAIAGHSVGYLVASGLAMLLLIGSVGLRTDWGQRSRAVSAMASFTLLNWAALVAFFFWITTRSTDRLWRPTVAAGPKSS